MAYADLTRLDSCRDTQTSIPVDTWKCDWCTTTCLCFFLTVFTCKVLSELEFSDFHTTRRRQKHVQNECVKAMQEENTYHRQVLPLLLDYTATICGRLVSGKDDISGVPV